MTRAIGWTITLAIVGFYVYQAVFALAEDLP
jgi:hypothetical protein